MKFLIKKIKTIMALFLLTTSFAINAQTDSQMNEWLELGVKEFKKENYKDAIHYFELGRNGYEKKVGHSEPDGGFCGLLSFCYDAIGDYAKAVEIGEQSLKIISENNNDIHPGCTKILNNLACYYWHLGDYAKSIELETQALEIIKETVGEKHPDYTTSLNNLANYYADLSDYTKSIELGSQALEIRKEIVGERHPDYAMSLNNLANYYAELGEYAKAIELGIQALEIIKETVGERHPDYATSLNNLANYYADLSDYTKSIELGSQALEIRKEIVGERHPDYATPLDNLATYYAELGEYAKAIELGNKALKIRKEALGENHPDYATSLNNLTGYYFGIGSFTEAFDCYQKSINCLHSNIFHQFCGLTSKQRSIYWSKYMNRFTDYYPSYAYLSSLCPSYRISESNHSMRSFAELALILFTLYFITWLFYTHYKGYNVTRRKWLFAFGCFITGCLLCALDRIKGHSESTCTEPVTISVTDVYDKSALFAKGLLLTTEIEMNKLIQESGDEEALSMFEELRQKRLMLQKLYEKPIAERFINTDSLEQEADKLESELVKRSQAYGDFSRRIRTTWQDVQSALHKDEMAVEFLSFGEYPTMVAALTLRKDDKEPKMIPLFEQKQMEKVRDIKTSRDRDVRKTKTFYSQEVTDLVWKPMAEELKGIKRIYFSAAGILHKVGIEYAPGMEDYDMYRLSTTREIIDMKEKGEKNLNAQSDAVLYGGVDYEALAKSKAPNEETRKNQKDEENTHRSISIDLHHAFIDSLKVRGTDLKYLPGTLDEVKHISSCFEQKHRKAIIGTDATETSVKSLPENLPKILHIATHGFYYTESEKKRMDARRDLRLLDDLGNSGRKEDEALNRSGLYMAGANRTLKGEELPMEADDGILTAQEIAKIDLRGVDLVVLSACETGQGDINQGEGVYGLQRGFKKAGVQTILMSLWKVSDKATEILMTEFYKQICSGQSIRTALRLAQKKVREYKNQEGKQQFEDPFFWAGFILLD